MRSCDLKIRVRATTPMVAGDARRPYRDLGGPLQAIVTLKHLALHCTRVRKPRTQPSPCSEAAQLRPTISSLSPADRRTGSISRPDSLANLLAELGIFALLKRRCTSPSLVLEGLHHHRHPFFAKP